MGSAIPVLLRRGPNSSPWLKPGVSFGGNDDVLVEMLASVPAAAQQLPDTDDQRWLGSLADQLRELTGQGGNQLLHWDLHYENVLAASREDWLAIDPKPLAGNVGFELMPALRNRWDEIVEAGDVHTAVRRRFDYLTEVVGIGRSSAAMWTLARVLQNMLWDIEDGTVELDAVQRAIAEAVRTRAGQ